MTEKIETTVVEEITQPADAADAKEDITEEVTAAKDQTSENGKEAKKKQRPKIYEVTEENDMKYLGPLSYRAFKMIAWAFIIMSQIGTILNVTKELHPTLAGNKVLMKILENSYELALPLLLIATFAILINGKDTYRGMLIKFGLAAGGMIAGFFFVYERYMIRIGTALMGSREAATESIRKLFAESGSEAGYFTFNIFMDVILFTLVVFFVNYVPKKLFQGKKIYIFRSLVALPVIYEGVCVTLKILAATKTVTLPFGIYPFLTTKSPVVFVLFVIVAFYMKNRERYFIKHGKTPEDYQRFLTTRTNSFQFSMFMTKMILIFALLDVILVVIAGSLYIAYAHCDVDTATKVVNSMGFGDASGLISVIPFLLLFSYTRKHSNNLIDILIPVASVAIIALLYIDALIVSAAEFLQMAG